MMAQQSDQALVEAARQGDKAAFGLLIERHTPLANRVARRMLADRADVEDLVQEAFLQAYLSLAQLRQPDHFANWLYGIVLNVCRNELRSRRLNYFSWEAMVGGLHFDAIPLTSIEPSLQEVAEAKELITAVREAVAGLSPKNRQATLLFYFEGCSLREIAAQLGVSVVAVKGRLHKARRQLHDRLVETYLAPMSHAAVVPSHQAKELTMIKVTVADVVVEQESEHRVVILLDEAGVRFLPIWIGPFEAESIALILLERNVPRPLTYQFAANILNAASIQLERICVSALQETTYYATVTLRSGDATHEIDARPSDAIALALHLKASIYVAEEVMERAGNSIPEEFQGKYPTRKGLDALQKAREEQWAASQPKAEAQDAKATSDDETKKQELLNYLFGETSAT